MSSFNSLPVLRSVGVGEVLTQTLQIRLGIAIAFTFFSLIELIAKPLSQIIAPINELISLVSIFVDPCSLIFFCVWLYRIHLDLNNLFDGYSITPGGSIARFLIPLYNIWGIANMYNTFADKFEHEGGDLSEFSKNIRSSILPLYSFMIASSVISRFIFPEFITNPENPSLPLIFFISAILDVALIFILLSLTRAMQSVVDRKAKRLLNNE
jgi:hypothetical protein